MTSLSDQVVSVAAAYRATLLRGDREFVDSPTEKKILQAVVASSVADTSTWIQTRLGSKEAAAPLDELFSVISVGNVVGKSWEAVKKKALEESRGAVLSLAGTGTAPVWIGAVISFIAGLWALSFNGGVTFANAAIPAILGGGATLYAAIRAAQAAPAVINAVGTGASSILATINGVGIRSERLFITVARPALDALYAQAGVVVPQRVPVLPQIRGAGRSLVIAAYIVLGVGVLAFAAGMLNVISNFGDSLPCPSGQVRATPGGACRIRFP